MAWKINIEKGRCEHTLENNMRIKIEEVVLW
jgi:hypothetical protein